MASDNFGREAGCCELRQRGIMLKGDFVDIRTDDGDVGVAKEHLDGLYCLPVGQPSWNGCSRCRNKCPVKAIDVKSEMDWSAQLTQVVKPFGPCFATGVRMLRIAGKEGRDAFVRKNSLRFLRRVGTNTCLKQPSDTEV